MIDKLPANKKKQLAVLLEALKEKQAHNKLAHMYPDDGPLRRELYPRHVEFFAAGAWYIQRLLMAGNRTGKTTAGGFEGSVHTTGRYPDWWTGRVFDSPIEMWACGHSSETTRDIVQKELLGRVGDLGSGMIPLDAIVGRPRPKAGGVPNAVDEVEVRWGGGGDVSGGTSLLGFKCYGQGRKSFEGTAKHVIWFDEESPMDVYNEAMMRITTTRGIIYTTFTPLQGLSELVMSFLPKQYSFNEAA